MAIPVIVPTTSNLGYPQWQPWTYQPFATGLSANAGAIAWYSSTLPPGMTLNATTGAISGFATQAGVYNVSLWVTDTTSGYGTSAALQLTVGIEARAFSSTSGPDLFIDTATGEVTTQAPGVTQAASAAKPWLFSLKEGDDLLLSIHFVRDGTIIDLGDLTELSLGLKEFEPDRTLILSTAFTKITSGGSPVYVAYVHFESGAFKAALSNYESDNGTSFLAITEIAWKEPNTIVFEPPVPTLLRHSQTFPVFAERSLIPAA